MPAGCYSFPLIIQHGQLQVDKDWVKREAKKLEIDESTAHRHVHQVERVGDRRKPAKQPAKSTELTGLDALEQPDHNHGRWRDNTRQPVDTH